MELLCKNLTSNYDCTQNPKRQDVQSISPPEMLMIARFILQIPEQIQSGADNDAASSFSDTRVKEREKVEKSL